MKTRIIYPKDIWYNKAFHALPSHADRLLAIYLVSNENIGLTRMYKQRDMEVCFIFGITQNHLEEIKCHLQESKLFIFKDEWVFIHNDFSYCDYFRNKETAIAKKKEFDKIPQEIRAYFKDNCSNEYQTVFEQPLNNIQTRFEQRSPINNKTKIINNKSEIINNNTGVQTLEEMYEDTTIKL